MGTMCSVKSCEMSARADIFGHYSMGDHKKNSRRARRFQSSGRSCLPRTTGPKSADARALVRSNHSAGDWSEIPNPIADSRIIRRGRADTWPADFGRKIDGGGARKRLSAVMFFPERRDDGGVRGEQHRRVSCTRTRPQFLHRTVAILLRTRRTCKHKIHTRTHRRAGAPVDGRTGTGGV